MMKRARWALLGCLLAFGSGAQGANITDREIAIVRAEYLFQSGSALEAEAVLREHLGEDSSDLAARGLLVKLLAKRGLGAEAEQQLRLMSARPEFTHYVTQLRARCRAREFDGWPAPYSRRSQWRSQAALSLGLDTNYGFVSDPIATSLEESTGSLYADALGSIVRTVQQEDSLGALRFGISYRQYVTPEARYYNALTPAAGYTYFGSAWQLAAQLQSSLLNLSGLELYLTSIDLRPGLRFAQGSAAMFLVLQYQVYGQGFSGDGAQDRTGPNAGFGASIEVRRTFLQSSLGLQVVRLQPTGEAFQGYWWMLPMVLNFSGAANRLSLEVSSSPGQRLYFGASPIRRDLWLDARASLHYALSPSLRVGIDGAWQKNNSNQDDYDFTKTEAAVFFRLQH